MQSPAPKPFRLNRLTDTMAEWIITVAGVAVILAMIAMLALIVGEAAPLFMPARQKAVGTVRLPDSLAAADVAALGAASDLHRAVNLAGIILWDGRAGFHHFSKETDGASDFALARLPEAPEGAKMLAVEPHGDGLFSVLWDDFSLSLYALRADFATDTGEAAPAASFVRVFAVALDPARGAPRFAMLRGDAANYTALAVYADGSAVRKTLRPAKGLRARGKGTEAETAFTPEKGWDIAAAALDTAGGQLYLGTRTGDIVSVTFPDDASAQPASGVTPAFRDRRPVTAVAFLNGDYALAVGDAQGGVSVWFPRREGGEFRFRRSVDWPARGGEVEQLLASRRNRGFFALGHDGGMRWLYSTNGRELLDIPAVSAPAVSAALNGRGDSLVQLDAGGALTFRRIDASYPEAGWRGFFGRLLYEGYEQPAYVWQSTGSDAAEPKLSLVPLIWGSVKGAVYALFFATPIALGAAMYLSQFAHANWRARLKPAVEMLAAVPSVVIGFLAALWLAPLLERHLQFVIRYFHYDQRNSLVIAIAMGFAVIPTIFSLAEDAITAVPPSLSAASLALGASKWQTVWRVVLPTASPGIFTAVMLGFGRAVGETMIVLMAAGNTPIISLSPFNGMRTLSANIAVEMPEAPVGETLYRTLFLCALALFLMTLVINTGAELMRHRLRNRFGRL